MTPDHPYYDKIVKDPRYKDEPKAEEFPMYESLKLTIERTLPYWNNVIVPQVKQGKKVIIAAHGNSLRGIVKHLDNLSDEQIMGLNLPTGDNKSLYRTNFGSRNQKRFFLVGGPWPLQASPLCTSWTKT